MHVLKRDGTRQPLDLQKIHAVLTWACDGRNDDALVPIKGVSVSQIEMQAQLHFHDGMHTKSIHEMLIRAASELISEDNPNYDHVAARLVWFSVRKEAFKNNLPPHLSKVVNDNVARGLYTRDILDLYTEDELDEINRMIRHERDDLFRYAGSEQMRKKYLCQNRKTKKIYESFQFPYILVAAILFGKYQKNERMAYVKKYYDLISTHVISLPTPIMAGVRTKEKQFSSCVLISSGDSLASINAVASAIVDYASRKAGLGVDIGLIRAEGQEVRNGDAITTGVLPFAKYFNAALKSCSQGAVRGASATFNYPVWHLEFEKLIELKNEKGTEETRLRTVDYCIHLNGFMYKRWAERGNITFFSPEEVPDLYDAFYSSNTKEFARLYTEYEAKDNITKKILPADVVFQKILTERFETGRLYILHADLANKGPFYERISMTNLCTEILQPTVPLGTREGRIALCTLSAINWGKFTDLSSEKEQKLLASASEMAVRGLDALLDYQNYPREEARRFIEEYRTLGIGVIGFAHWLTKNRLIWGSEDAIIATHKMMETMAYHLTSTSIQLAKEFGPCKKHTKYHDGWMPMDRSPVAGELMHDWDALRLRAKEYGIRNATLTAMMPSETSSQLANETNGIEPPRDLITIKGSKEGVLPQLVPEFARLNSSYETLWKVKASAYLNTVAVLQKFTDQTMSTNTSYDPGEYGGQIPLSVLATDLLTAYKKGIVTLYYNNTRDGQSSEMDDGCAGGACKI
jgi:ribonucleoside-diphosphate reductase alpha chain